MGLIRTILTHALRMGAAVVMAAALCACAVEQRPAPKAMIDVAPGELFGADARPLPMNELARRASYAGYVLVGESHSSACDHLVQADILKALTAGGKPPVLGLEMLPTEKQPALDRFNAGEIGPDELEEAVDWKKVWGHAYAPYKPIFETARAVGAPLVALNVPRRVVEAVGKGGYPAVEVQDRVFLPYEIIPASPEQARHLGKAISRHSGMMGALTPARRERFLRIQALWDTAMAEAAVRARRDYRRPVLILAGSGHVERGWGIARRLQLLDPRSATLTVVPWRGGATYDPADADAFSYCGLSHTSRLGFVLEERGDEVLVTGVAPDTRAAKAGFVSGDVLLTVMGEPADSMWALHKGALKAGRDKRPLLFTVRRGDQTMEMSIELSGTEAAPESAPDATPEAAPDAAPGQDPATSSPVQPD